MADAPACSTITGSPSLVTAFSTSVGSSVELSTGSSRLFTTSSASLVTSCFDQPCSGNATSCAQTCTTSTSFIPITSTIPGSVVTFTSFFSTVFTDVSTEPGPVSTICPTTTTTTTTTSDTSSSLSSTSPTPTTSSATTTVTPSTTTTWQPTTTSTPEPTSRSNQAGFPTSPEGLSTITSYSTFYVTDSAGVVGTSTSLVTIPTLVRHSHSASASTGAIAGGVVGGVLALLLVALILWYMRKRGFLSRRGPAHFNDDMWKPSPHSAAGELDGPDGDGEGASAERNHESSSGEDFLSEKSLASRRQSWYDGFEGYLSGGAFGHERTLSGQSQNAATATTYAPGRPMSEVSNYAPEYEIMGAAAGARNLSHRRSLQSHSSHHSHDGYPHGSPNSYHSSLPDRGRSLSNLDRYFMNIPPQQNDAGREELVSRSNSATSNSTRTHATTGSIVSYPSRTQLAMTSMPAVPPNLATTTVQRPHLEITSGAAPVSNGTTSSSGTNSSFSSSVPASTNLSTIPSSSTSAVEVAKPFKLARPSLERKYSDDSLLQPSQFLGARVTNVTPNDEKDRLDFNGTEASESNSNIAATPANIQKRETEEKA